MTKLEDLRCVVLGAGGFIGTNLCRALSGRVASLRAFGRRQTFPEAMHDIEWLPGDFGDPTSVASAIAGCDTVFHLINATTPASANIDKLADLQSNVAGTLRLLDACREEKVKRIIFVSSGGTIYGVPHMVPTPEDAPTDPITAYGISKLSIEKYLALYEYLYGIEHRILRVANPFGPYQTALKSQGAIAAFMHKGIANQPVRIWGSGDVIRDYIYIDDVVEALLQASTHNGPNRVFNIGSGEGRNLLQIISAIEAVAARSLRVEFLSSRSVDIPKSVLNCHRAEIEMDWTPHVSFEDGIRRTWSWVVQQHSNPSH